ncbi:gluconeogenesis factor YvcK family protein [Vallicoccus soli]|uniref:Putative gluconeogenesis factor n=1 Tax=Vallicoccus soli TaxID=2339232 RepID=A0A3A3YQU5_9ACTN|nr:uridine diphosphate-N-acetylglucosamine-binding protein YvcK [Vallicoccus soli]RJK93746.1 uridine diphosphate-N-acetylglucosamine-binding protein YvcK [Vallicoccus soli]
MSRRPGRDAPSRIFHRRVVALGGGHGLAASLQALRRVTDDLTAVVTVGDDGGSSGRLRRELGVLPPGDLRMALAALCGDDDWGHTWSEVLQHRFASRGELHGHALGNLLIVALWERFGGNPVAALDLVGELLGAQGRVLPMATVPLEICATVGGLDPADPLATAEVRGQVAVATTPGRVLGIRVEPEEAPACAEAVAAVLAADAVVLGPGSWFTSVIPHLLVPGLAEAILTTPAQRVLALNLAPQAGETSGFSPETHLEVLAAHAPALRIDTVLADAGTVSDREGLERAAASLDARLVLAPVAVPGGEPRHDVELLAAAYAGIFADGRM